MAGLVGQLVKPMDDRVSSLKSNCVSYTKSWHLYSRLDCDQELTSLLSSQANKSSFSTSSCRIVWMMIAAIAPLSTRWSKCYDHLVLVVPHPVPNDHLHIRYHIIISTDTVLVSPPLQAQTPAERVNVSV